ncbi:10956_t:CDS:2 [Diversispora eburnea]|uniref:10956_t:CDS:1 n=1 Tax=Diversispora eburnea TaxID=1213867 RepID=A0A9N9F011_9GLOM|nr:10956_t:CDS:2 [Diversispora eburnea]
MCFIIALSFVLAVGFLLVILSGALYGNWLIVLVAPLPNWVTSRCAGGYDYYSDGQNNGCKDFGQFITAIFIVTGVCLPLVLAHCEVITYAAMVMSIAGGLLVYATIIAYSTFFANEGDEF